MIYIKMETQLCKIIRDLRELKEDIDRLYLHPLGTTGVPESYDHILSEIMDLLQIPKKQQELFWILSSPDKDKENDG